MLLERSEIYVPFLHQAIHSLFYSDVYVFIDLLGFKIILVYDFLENKFDCYIVIFIFLHWIVQIEVLGIYNKLFSIWGGEDNVTIEFGRV